MEGIRIYQLLSKASRPQLNRFEKFIASPYFNKNAPITALSEVLIQSIKTETSPPSKHDFWNNSIKATKGEYDDLKFRKICNDVLDRYEQFLINEELAKNRLLKSNLLLSSIKENKLIGLAEKHISKSAKVIERSVDQSADFYLQKYMYNKSIYNLKTNYEKKAQIKKTIDSITYKDLSENLDAFYVIEKLRHATDVLSWRKIYKSNIEVDISTALMMIDNLNLSEIPAVKIYHLMYLLMSDDGTQSDFKLLRGLAEEQIDVFPASERREILDVLLTYCIKESNKGSSVLYEDLLNLYDWGIDSEIMLENGTLSPTTFRNYVLAGLRSSSYPEVEKFIKLRAPLLEQKHRENAVYFSSARLNFYKKNYNEVITNLSKVNYDDVFYAVESRMLLMATYFENGDFDPLESTVDAFLKFLQREKKLESFKKNAYLNFCKYLRRFIQFKEKDYDAFMTKIVETNPMYNKAWLLKKVEAYKA